MNRIKEAAKEDILSYTKDTLKYLTGVSLPVTVIFSAVFLISKFIVRKPVFVDWDLKDWIRIYNQDVANAVSISYKGAQLLLPQILIFDNTKSQLDLKDIYFIHEGSTFQLPQIIKGITEEAYNRKVKLLRTKKQYRNEKNLRLKSIQIDKATLNVEDVYYKDYIHTNMVLDFKKNGHQTLRNTIHKGKLEKLEESVLANHLGINILLFTIDNKLILLKRSKRTALMQGQLCSVSGAFNATGVLNNSINTPVPFSQLLSFLYREAVEEIGVKAENIFDLVVLGITRELIRGGKPELFTVAKVSSTELEVKKQWIDAKSKEESSKIFFFPFDTSLLTKDYFTVDDAQFFAHEIDRFLDEYLKNAAITLLTNIALWKNYVLNSKFKHKIDI